MPAIINNTARIVVIGPLMALLCGCPTVAPQVRTQVLTVTRDRYVQIPAKLTQHCPIKSAGPTVGDAVEVARERRASLEGCNAQLDQIRAIQGTPVEH